LAAYDALRARAGAARPVLVFGTSLGTSAALCVAARRPDVAGVVLQNPPPFRQIILRGWGWWNLWLVAGPAALAIPSEIESVPNARACHRRAVFLLSQQDEVVRPRYARLVLGAYAGEKRVIRLPGARHNSPLDAAETRALHADVAWLLAAAPRTKP
jgi:pimeloyl-ACP methyl ester carboxylesterase